MTISTFSINERRIAPGEPVYIIAEMSANHNQSFEQAAEIVRAAKECGADAIKLQTYTADTLTIPCDSPEFRVEGTLWAGRTLHDLYQEAFTPWEWQPRLQKIATELGLGFFSTPFDDSAVAFLEEMQVPVYKVASFEANDVPLLRRIARTGKPIILSTGMATLSEIEEAVTTIRQESQAGLALLKCTSAYPALPEEMNLRTIPHLAEAFQTPVGLSDHTLGVAVPVAAVAMGACVIEKHFTLARSQGGPDSAFSLEPQEFKQMVEAVRVAERALGTIHYGISPREGDSRVFRRSLFVTAPIKAGEPFTGRNVRSIRPGHGLQPRYLDAVLGRHARKDLVPGTPLSWAHVA